MKAGGLSKNILHIASWSSLILLLLAGGIKKDVLLLYLSSLALSWKAARAITQEIEERDYSRLMRAATEPLHTENVRLSYDLGSLRSENAALQEADRLLWQRADEAEKVATSLREDIKSFENNLAKVRLDVREAEKQLAIKEVELRDLDLYNERLSVQLDERSNVERQKVEIQREENRKLQSRMEEAQRKYAESLKTAHADEDKAREALSACQARVVVLQEEIARLHKPRRLTEVAWYKEFCNAACDWLGEIGLPVHLLRASENEGALSLVVRPQNLSDLPLLETVSSKMFQHFEMPVKPIVEISVHEAVIHIYDKKKAKERKFFIPTETWFEDLLIREKGGKVTTRNGRFVGESETGKSTVLANAIGCVEKFVLGVKFLIGDPLFHVGDSDWKGHKVTYKTEAECYQGLLDFYQLFNDRKDNIKQKTHTLVFCLDEFDTMIANYPALEPIVKALWKQGRHAETYLWTSGQSPLVADFGLRRDDIQNCFGMYLGTTIPRSFADCFITGEEAVKWHFEYNERKKAGEQYLVFVRPKGDVAFMTQTPAPGTYAVHELEGSSTAQSTSSLNGRSDEFDLKATRKSLESLASMSSEEVEAVRVRELFSQGIKPYDIVYQIWGVYRGSSKTYKDKKAFVERILKDIK